MAGILKYLFSRTKLHQVAQIHNADTVGNVADNGQVVGDEQICQILALLQLLKQVDYLGLYGHIQCGYALIANDELGLYSQSTGNADALTLTTGELVRVAMEHIALQAALLHNVEYVLLHLGVARLEELMRNKTLAYYLAHGHARVKRRI